MVQRFSFIALLAFITALISSKIINSPRYADRAVVMSKLATQKKNIIRCGPDWEALNEIVEEMDIPLIPGAGKFAWKISTKNDSAQVYFNQGMSMYYSFHIIEAMASFRKAVRFDPQCAMLHWAQALAYGPNINDLGYIASPQALEATQKAVEFSSTAGSMEKALINAMAVRYTADSADATRAKLNQEYTAMMKKVAESFSKHPDAAALYVDAMMLEHPWDLWYVDGKPKAWTATIREVLEKLLVMAPNHPGANHYYIHVMEPSPFAYKALPSANRLGSITPGLSHTVHMPSHIYLRTGQYRLGVAVNEFAVNSHKRMLSVYGPASGNEFLYTIHNLHMQTINAMMAGLEAESISDAQATAKSIPADYFSSPAPLGNYIQYIYMTPVLAEIRFGKWDELLKEKQPGKELVYANLLYHFGRGMAWAGMKDAEKAIIELDAIQQLMKDSSLYIPFTPFAPAIDGAAVAENLLSGTISLLKGDNTSAIASFSKAVTTEEGMVYNEPRDWMLNPKHYLGTALLKAGKPADAERVFRRDLANNDYNGWALYGLYKSLLAQKKKQAASGTLKLYKRVFGGTGLTLSDAIL